MNAAQIAPALVTSLIAWRIYARVRRNIGRQRLQKRRLVMGIVVVSVLTLAIAAATRGNLHSLAGLGGGMLLGVPVAFVGLRLTRFETTAEGDFYTPNTYLGLVLTLLVVGRMTYRFIVLFANPPRGGEPVPAIFHSPLTLLLFGLTAGYYIAYYAGVIRHVHKPGEVASG